MDDNKYIPLNKKLNNKLITKSDNFHISLNKFYVCFLIFIIFIMTFNIVGKDKIKNELREQMKEEIKNQIETNLISKLKSQDKIKKEMKEEIKNQIQTNLLANIKRYIKRDALKKLKVGLCVIGKKENRYAKEFVDYYKSIGFDHIFVYDNNDKDDESFEDVLSEDISKNYVSIINFRGYRGERNQPQFEAYIDCYEKNSKEYDWLAFYDFDEFLYLKHHKTIQDFVVEDRFDNCSNIKINWIIYSDNDLIYYENKPVQERFTTPLPQYKANFHIKSLVRGNLPTNYWTNMKNPHTSDNDYICCLATGKEMDSRSPFNDPPNFDESYIIHYNTKTIEEFIEKAGRGSATEPVVKDEKFWRNKLFYFFSINKKSKEKLDYIKKVLNLDVD